eukprot:9456653-Prorocentrum_lima.AAC.1
MWQATDNLSQAQQECSKWAGVMDDGSDWTVGLPITAEWEEFLEHAKGTIMKRDGRMFGGMDIKLSQADQWKI